MRRWVPVWENGKMRAPQDVFNVWEQNYTSHDLFPSFWLIVYFYNISTFAIPEFGIHIEMSLLAGEEMQM